MAMATSQGSPPNQGREERRWPYPMIDYYAILGVPGRCQDEQTLQKAYEEKVLEWNNISNDLDRKVTDDRLQDFAIILLQARDALLDCTAREAYALRWDTGTNMTGYFREVQDLAGYLAGSRHADGKPKTPTRGCGPWRGAINDPGRCTTPVLRRDILDGICIGFWSYADPSNRGGTPVRATFSALGKLAMAPIGKAATGASEVAEEDVTMDYRRYRDEVCVCFWPEWEYAGLKEFEKKLFNALVNCGRNPTVWSTFEDMAETRDDPDITLLEAAQVILAKTRRPSGAARNAPKRRAGSLTASPFKRKKTAATSSTSPVTASASGSTSSATGAADEPHQSKAPQILQVAAKSTPPPTTTAPPTTTPPPTPLAITASNTIKTPSVQSGNSRERFAISPILVNGRSRTLFVNINGQEVQGLLYYTTIGGNEYLTIPTGRQRTDSATEQSPQGGTPTA